MGDAEASRENNSNAGPADVAQRLAEASATERTDFVLSLIDTDPDHALRLLEFATSKLSLDGIQLGAGSLKSRAGLSVPAPSWWDSDEGAGRLQASQWHGASLCDADFSGADLRGADFTKTALRSARMRGCRIEEAIFRDADLIGIDLSETAGGEAAFEGALLEDANFARAALRFANFRAALLESADFEGADLWGARLDGAEASYAVFRNAHLQEAGLAGTDLTGADLQRAALRKASFKGSRLKGANLQGADLSFTDFEGADFTSADLARANLSTCNIRHARMAGALLEKTWFSVEQIGALGEEIAGEYEEARQGYLNLEQNFRSTGNPDAASWAYRRARRMGKQHARNLVWTDMRTLDWRRAAVHSVWYLSDVFVEWLCDYGENLMRVMRAYVVTLVLFAAFYGVSGSLMRLTEASPGPLRGLMWRVGDLLTYSFLTMTTSSLPEIGFKPSGRMALFMGSLQYTIGVVLIGLFGYVLGNRIRR